MVEQSTGGFIAVSRYASATPLPPSILSRGVGWQVHMVASFILSLMWINFTSLRTIFYGQTESKNTFPSLKHKRLQFILYKPSLILFILCILILGSGHSFLWHIRHWEWFISICVRFFCS